MACSILAISRWMDPVTAPQSVRELARRHRWLTGLPPDPLSLLSICLRHHHPQASIHHVLWYNTFLLQGFELSLCNLIILGRILEKMELDPRAVVGLIGVTPAEIVDTLKISKHQLVDGLGITLDELKSTFGDVVDGLLNVLSFGTVDIDVDDILDEVSIHDLLNRFDVTIDWLIDGLQLDPLTLLSIFCKQTVAFLVDQSPLFFGALGVTIHIQGKPERWARAKEIGQAVAPDYEIVGLCEVFETSSLSSIVEEAMAVRTHVETATGPDDTGELASSGLLTLALDTHIVGRDRTTFTNKGDPLRDADAWSNKGVLRTVIDVGLGKLEIYSTHLMAGGGIPIEEWILGPNPAYKAWADAEVFATQKAQLGELVSFVNATHNPANVAMIVGDFNLEAQAQGEYNELIARMHELHTLDLWPYHRHREPPTSQDIEHDLEGHSLPRGDTNASKDNNSTSDVGRVCKPETDRFCDDRVIQKKEDWTSRIDYIFVENPRPEHTFTLDVTRVQRRPFFRPGASGDQERFLSDHLGLDFTLLVSPR